MEIDDRSIRDFPTMDGRAREGVVDREPRRVRRLVVFRGDWTVKIGFEYGDSRL